MKVGSMIKVAAAGVLLFAMLGCGGTSSSEEGPDSVTGGPPNAPTPLSLHASNEIKKNAYYNHYSYEAVEGETLSIHTVLDNAITKTMRIECQENGDTFVAVYDVGMNQLDAYRTCTSTMTLEFMADGIYILQFQYPGNEGYFTADSVKH